jgi:predicted RNA-binding Zn-ribbon protein involved in translation (DUF1610 family)
MDIFIASENIECCRKCGTRTITMTSRLSDGATLESCPNCGYKYLLEQPDGDDNDVDT